MSQRRFQIGMGDSEADVLIIGGGTGGVAAALAATALGKRVIMTEPTRWVGGQLTSQAVPPDENMSIDTHGGTRRYRLMREAIRRYYREYTPLSGDAQLDPLLNPGGGYVSGLCFAPNIGHTVLQNLLHWPIMRGLLDVRLERVPVKVETKGDRIEAVTVRNNATGALETLRAPYILDATELGDLLPMGGVEYVVGAESQKETGERHAVAGPAEPDNVQAITWCFPMAMDPTPGANHVIDKPAQYERWRSYVPQTDPPYRNPLLSWYVPHHETGEIMERALYLRPDAPKEWFRGLWGYRQIVTAQHYEPKHQPHEVTLVNWPQNDYFVESTLDRTDEDLRRVFEEARQVSLSLMYWVQTEAPRHDGGVGYPEMYLRPDLVGSADGMALYPYIRESRRIKAVFTVLEHHVSEAECGDKPSEPFADSVGIGHYSIDLHNSTNSRPGVHVPTKPFRIPLGALLPIRVKNLLPACKNLGVTHITNGCYRLHPVEWNIGESAGALAAFCLDRGTTPHAVRESKELLDEFQNLLHQAGVPLAWPGE